MASFRFLGSSRAIEAELDELANLVGKASGTRPRFLEKELAKPASAWPFAPRPVISCDPARKIPIKGTFKSTWNTGELAAGFAFENSLQVTLGGAPLAPPVLLSNAGPGVAGRLSVGLVALELDGRMEVVQLLTTRPSFEKGELRFHGFETFGVLLTTATPEEKEKLEAQAAANGSENPIPGDLVLRGYISDGSIRFEEVGMKQGDVVYGSFEGVFTYTMEALGGGE